MRIVYTQPREAAQVALWKVFAAGFAGAACALASWYWLLPHVLK